MKVEGFRIGWLDSCRMPSRIHRTLDGIQTICCHPYKENIISGRWVQINEVPRHAYGQRRYCRTCFKKGGKTIPWFSTNTLIG